MAEAMRPPEWFSEAKDFSCPSGKEGRGRGFIEKNLEGFSSVMLSLILSEETAAKPGLLQRLDGRARMAGMFIIILSAAFADTAALLIFLLVFTYALASLSGAGPVALFKRVIPAFVFTGVLAVPVFFTVRAAAPHIPGVEAFGYDITVTQEGIWTGLFFLLRVTVMVSLSSLLLLATRQADFFRGLRALGLPAFFVAALFMTVRYIFILLKIAEDSTLARKSRTLRSAGLRESEGWFASRVAFLLKKSLSMAEEVHMAIVSRGFSGSFRSLRPGDASGKDYLWLGLSVFFLFLSFGF